MDDGSDAMDLRHSGLYLVVWYPSSSCRGRDKVNFRSRSIVFSPFFVQSTLWRSSAFLLSSPVRHYRVYGTGPKGFYEWWHVDSSYLNERGIVVWPNASSRL